LETFPEWGIMRGGVLWALETPALPIAGTESGYWATPNARDWKDSAGMSLSRKDGRAKVDQTPRQAFQFWKDLGVELSSRRATTGRGVMFNPEFSEWLMGWPMGWTALEPLAMDRFRQWLNWHGISSARAKSPEVPSCNER
jgi:hypothetical protein